MASILLIALDARKPSTRLRILPLATALREQGHDVTLVELPRGIAGRLGLLRMAATHDVVVLQKKLFPAAYLDALRRANPRLIFDVDDAVMFHELERNEALTGRHFVRFCHTAAASRIVVAGNGFVAEFARLARQTQGNKVFVLPTPVDTRTISARSDGQTAGPVVVGWIGTKGNLQQLTHLAEPLREVASACPNLRLKVIADGNIELPGVPVEHKPWRAEEEADDLRSFDIGIMPLADSLWNRGKGGYKLLQYMAAGLPAVASPIGINAEIIHAGENGLLASTPQEWRDQLLHLARNPELRTRMGRAARSTIEARFSLDRYLARYVELVESCLHE